MTSVEATLERLEARLPELREAWSSAKPFRFLVVDDFLEAAWAQEVMAAYPTPESDGWDDRTFAHQRNKLTMTSGFPDAVQSFFDLTANPKLIDWLGRLTGIDSLLFDDTLQGGGLHLIKTGGFLDVHVDYNYHPITSLHRRLNLLLYMNPDWKTDYAGALELWDMDTKSKLADIEPFFNRVVVFETNEVSYHGHPRPWAGPSDVHRRSLAVYYYTQERDGAAPEHNTIYRQTTGLSGYVKTARSSLRAGLEHVKRDGVVSTTRTTLDKIDRRIRGLPPRNG